MFSKLCIRFFPSGYGIFEILFNRTKFNALSDDLKQFLNMQRRQLQAQTRGQHKKLFKRFKALIVKDKVRVADISRSFAKYETWDKVTAERRTHFQGGKPSAKAWAKK